MLKLNSILFSVCILSALNACSVSNNVDSEKKTESYSYDYDVNGCKTGKQTASSRAEYCEKLQNESLNNGCAQSLRQMDYQQNCTSSAKIALGIASNAVFNYKYSFSVNGCSTGEQSFDSLEVLCEALQDDEFNNHCARELREQMFRSDCLGE